MSSSQTNKFSGASAAKGYVASLWSFAFLSYVLRTNIAVAQQGMARDLHLSNVQIGQVFTAFLVGYTIFQFPAGLLGDRYGPRLVLALSALSWALTTFLTGWLPGLVVRSAAASLAVILIVRFVHGLEESTTFPVAMTAVADWFQPENHAFITALIFTGSTLGSAFAPPLVAYLMEGLGWRATFYLTAILPVMLAIVWWKQTKGRQHKLRPRTLAHGDAQKHAGWLALLLKKDVAILCLSYLLYCYAISIFVYWLFKYLVDVRHLSTIGSGWATSLPWIVASVAVPVSGHISRRISARVGRLNGRRIIATTCLAAASLLVFVGAEAQQIGLALGAIAISVGLMFSTESSYWSTAIDAGSGNAGAASGLMNLAGNGGGVLSTLLVPFFVQHLGWFYALLSGSCFALVAAICWFALSPVELGAGESTSYTESLPRDIA